MTAVEAFRELARRYSRCCRRYDRMAAQGSRDQVDEALTKKQELENEFAECFVMRRVPVLEEEGA